MSGGKMKRVAIRISIALLVAVLGSASAWAQATAEISGTVRDQSGAVLPGVEVTMAQTETGIVRSTVTNETGNYVMTNLPLGPYRLQALLPGFRTFSQTGIVLQVGSSAVINPVLEVGQVSESVDVQADAALVETRNQGVGQVIQNAQILELPLNGRNVTELITLTPATVYGGDRHGAGGYINSGVFNANTTVSIAGGSFNMGLSYTLDGANHNQPQSNQNLSVPFPDALQEFKVETSAAGAQSGMHGSGGVTLVTKSGTNQFHGNLFEFVRNYKFNARNPFAASRDTMKRNQFGGTVGGPIIENKLFFFGGYQGTTIRAYEKTRTNFVPTPAMLAGDFTAITSPTCNAGRQIALRAPFVNNQINPAQFSPVITRLVNRADFPRSSDPCGRFVWGNPDVQNLHFPVVKIDYQRSANHSMFGRYMVESRLQQDPYELTKMALSQNNIQSYDGLEQAFTFGDTYTFGSNLVNAFRLWANRTAIHINNPEFASWKSLGASIWEDLPPFLITDVTGGFNINTVSNGGQLWQGNATFGLSDDVSTLRGNHQLSFGFSGLAAYQSQHSPTTTGGSASFNGSVSNLGLADFLLGEVFVFQQSGPHKIYGYQRFLGLYGSDTWKATQKLTVNFGLRWEPFLPFKWTDGTLHHFSADDMRKGIRSTQYVSAPPGLSYPGDPNYPDFDGAHSPIRWQNFSPRLGLAWDVTGDGKTSVRVAAGTFYDFVPFQSYCCSSYSPPFLTYLFARNVKIENPWSAYPEGNPFPLSYGRDARFPNFSQYTAYKTDAKNPQVQQWNVSVQRQIGPDWLVSASYLGNHTIHLWGVRHLNPAVYIPGNSSTANTEARRTFTLENPQLGPSFGTVEIQDDGGTSSYNGLVLTAQRRFSRGFSINANHTWSHCISVPTFNIASFSGAGYRDPNNRNYDRGNCDSDRRHNFNFTGAVETPRFSDRTLQTVAGGWRLAPILRLQSGQFLTITTAQDVALSGIPGQRPSQISGTVYGDKSIKNYLNPSAFSRSQLGTLGNMRMGMIAGPGYWNLDLALSKEFRRSETQKVEIRVEAFNFTNSFRPNNPTTVFESNTFGQILSARDPRIMQFALKYFF
jgi:hypothetical protein